MSINMSGRPCRGCTELLAVGGLMLNERSCIGNNTYSKHPSVII